jgi:co-chaperonin GroES (HSP10)
MNNTIDMQTHEPFSKSSDWITDESEPTPKDLPKVCGWQLLIRPMKLQKKTRTGIIIPDGAHADIEAFTNIGEVLAMGDMAYKDDRFGNKPWCKVGDFVVYHRHAGTKFRWKKIKMLLIPDDKIMLVVKSPTEFDASEDISDFKAV